MRPYILVLLAVLSLATVGDGQSTAPAMAPKLILVVAIDQMRFDFLDRFAPLYKSGLKTLIDRVGDCGEVRAVRGTRVRAHRRRTG